MLLNGRVIKEFGVSLASAVFLDALVVRCLLLPAVLHIIGPRTWQIPAALDRVLPRINIEGTSLPAADPARNGHGPLPSAGAAPRPLPEVAAEGAEG
jgi:RND superfamily putative drug exporter